MAKSRFEFDDTREAIGTENLSASERKAMLDKFKSAGGKVLSEKELRAQEKEATNSTKSGKRGGAGIPERKLPSQMAREKARQESDRLSKKREETERIRKSMSGPMSKLMIRFRCFLAGLTPLSSATVRSKFMNFLALDVKQALVEFNLAGNDLFLQRPSVGRKIIKELDTKTPLYMETLEYAHDLYDHETFERLLKTTNLDAHADVPLSEIENEIKRLYAQLYLLYPFQETYKSAMKLAYDIYLEKSDSNTESKAKIEDRKKRIIKDTKAVFGIAFPKLFQLVCRIDGLEYRPFSSFLEKSLDIDPDDKLGKRKRGEESQLASNENIDEDKSSEPENVDSEKPEGSQEEAQEKEKSIKPLHQTKEYKYGIHKQSLLFPLDMRRTFDPENQFSLLPISNKLFLAYLFFKEFDQEYSFVLTTNRIKLNTDYSAGVKTDYKSVLTDLYNQSRSIINSFEKFYQSVQELEKKKKKKLSSNYVEQSKIESKAQSRVDVETRNTRGLLRSYMEQVSVQMAKLLSDMKGPKLIIGNMDDKITFSAVEGTKKLNDKTVKECIMEAYCYSLALKERIESGDLYGGVHEMTDDELISSFGSTMRENDSEYKR